MTPFSLACREQQQLFENSWDYVADLAAQPGGVATVVARFLTQFFYSPAAAMSLTIALLVLAAFLAWNIFRKRTRRIPAVLLSAVPSILLYASLADNNLHYDILAGYIFALLGLNACLNERIQSRDFACTAMGLLITIFLYFIAGPCAFVFALSATALEIFSEKEGSGKYLSLSYIAVAALAGFLAFRNGAFGTISSAFLPDFFYEEAEVMKKFHLAFWFSLPVCCLAASIPGKSGRNMIPAGVAAVLVSISAVWSRESSLKILSRTDKAFYKCEFFAVNGRWEELEKESRKNIHQYLMSNYYNLAKAEQGRLTEDLFKAPQNGPMSLIYIEDGHNMDVRLAHVLYAMGNYAAAQSVAFNLLQSNCGYNPSMMKIVADVDIRRGSFKTARKYLAKLGKAPHYAKWVASQKLEASPESFPEKEAFVLNGSVMDDLFNIIESNPTNAHSMDYALSYLLLCKDITNVYRLIDKNFGRPGFENLPIPAQEALVFFYDYFQTTTKEYALAHGISAEEYDEFNSLTPEYLHSHGVTEETIARFETFKKQYGRTGGSHAPGGYSDTFWNYMLFTKI